MTIMMDDSWDMECNVQNECNGQNFLPSFLPFFALLPPNNQENQNEENTSRYQHFTNVYHKWQSYGNGSWDVEPDGQNVLPFYPWKIKILEIRKKHLEI